MAREQSAAGKVVFLDRDGVINRDAADYVKSWEEFVFLPGALAALRLLHQAGRRVIVVTNQSAVGRGLITAAGLADLHARLKRAVAAAGGRIEDIFHCPHTPADGCRCRKPATGLIEQAVAAHRVAPASAVMVGDSAKDILCAARAGVGRKVLVLTGNGRTALAELSAAGVSPDHVAADLLAAARWITGAAGAAAAKP